MLWLFMWKLFRKNSRAGKIFRRVLSSWRRSKRISRHRGMGRILTSRCRLGSLTCVKRINIWNRLLGIWRGVRIRICYRGIGMCRKGISILSNKPITHKNMVRDNIYRWTSTPSNTHRHTKPPTCPRETSQPLLWLKNPSQPNKSSYTTANEKTNSKTCSK